jgi:hypothetical protein
MQVSRSSVLPTTPQESWAVLMDWERQADWMLDADRVTVLSEVREGAGVRLAVRTRLFGIPVFTERIEVVGWQPPTLLVIRHGRPMDGTGTWLLEPTDEGTRLTWTEAVTLRLPVVGEMAVRLYRPVLRMLMDRAMTGLRRHVIAMGPARTRSVPARRPYTPDDLHGELGRPG